MPNYNFNLDLPIAKKTEKQIADFLCVRRSGFKFLSGCDNADYDILMEFPNGREYSIEIKEDFSCKRTGNVGVEFECRGKKSGISISKADIYAYKVHQPDGKIALYLIATALLKNIISKEKYFRIVSGGDKGSNSKNYLFKLDIIKEHFSFFGYLPE